ncbi:two-component sensor histidine kinase [Lactiplantibacillus plantarum]|nr:two-component sensor histidine kinase [Lactiplantibacillus plantarum]
MLESNHWIQQYFSEATDAVLIYKDDQLVISNQLARDLQAELNFDPNYLIQIANNAVQQKFNTTDDCFDCVIRNLMPEISIPITLAADKPHPLAYFLIYHVINTDERVFSLTLKNRGTIKRMDQLAQQRQLNAYVNRAHEEERKKISADLHDSIAQGIYSAIMGIRRINAEQANTDEVRALTHVIEAQLEDTLTEVKGMALDIRPSVLDNFGLLAALRALAKRLQANSGVTITVTGNDEPTQLATDVQNVLYRIGQESINNALKHANEINLLLVAHDHYITLEIIDDGQGFNVPDQATFNGHSLGLLNMNERVKALNGTFTLHSQPGSGTSVTAKFPMTLTP